MKSVYLGSRNKQSKGVTPGRARLRRICKRWARKWMRAEGKRKGEDAARVFRAGWVS